MTIRKLAFKAGVQLDDTTLTSEGGFSASNWIRFRRLQEDGPNLPETMPGWEGVSGDSFSGIARGAHAWLDRTSQPLLAWGTHNTVYAYIGGELRNITPKWGEFFLTDPFSTVTGTPTVTVLFNVFDPDSNTSTIAPHGLAVGDTVNFSFSDAIGGITPNGAYTIVSVPDPTRFTFTHGSNASSTATMSGAAKVWTTIDFKVGLVDGIGGTGYGTGSYGIGPYGLPSIGDYQPRINSFDSLGDKLYYVPRGGPLFGFQPENQYSELIFNTNFSSSGQGWAGGTGWSFPGTGATATAGTASNLSQSIVDTFDGGKVYRVTLTVTRTAGAGYVGINAGSPPAVVRLTPDIVKSGTYTFQLQSPADPKDIVFSKDNAFAGTIDNWSVTVEPKLYRITEAPIASDSMFVDQRGIIFLCSTYQVDGVFNPTCVRNSDLSNERAWVPDTDSLATEYILTKGGRAVAGRASRGNVAIWTDDAYYAGPYTAQAGGPAYNLELAGTGCGLVSALAVAEQGAYLFWMTNSGRFYTVSYDLQGSRPLPIECSGQRAVFSSLAPAQEEKIYAVANAENNEVWFCYPDMGTDVDNPLIEINSAAILSVTSGVWSFTALDRTAAVKSGVFQYPIMFSPAGRFYYHEKGDDADGSPLDAYIETSDLNAEDGENLAVITRFWPDFHEQRGNVDFLISGKMSARDTYRDIPAKTFSSTTEKIDFRMTARIFKFRITGPVWRFGALSFDYNVSSARK